MPQYSPPLRDMQFVMHEVLKVTDEFKAIPKHADVDVETINAVLEEAGKFAAEVTFPLNISGDEEGCKLDKTTHEVTPPKGFKEAYAQYVEGGWAALSCDPEYGGQGLPFVLNQCLYEMLNSANQAWTMYPGLSHGAYEALHAHGSAEQKEAYLSKLTAGQWTGTMCLTEAHCGTDLGIIKTRAVPQARSLSGVKAKDKPADPIIVHPDVRKMLLTAKAYAEGGRALAIYCTLLLDKELHHPDEKVRKDSGEIVALLTPIVKAFLTDNGHIATNACMQVFGGHGFIKEWGMEQFVRDNRINMIYEGTNTIQSLDLLGRKVLGNNGATLKKFGKLVGALIAEEGVNEKMAEFINPLAYLADQMTKFTTELGFKGFQNPDEVGAAAVDYLRVAGHLVFGYFWALMAQTALREIAAGNTDKFYSGKLQTARFYFAKLFPETATLMRTARAGSKSLMETDDALA
jgi:alkylation response protein AidB-like acyl-CoA dehydrogenase